MNVILMEMKQCSKCGERKGAGLFVKRRAQCKQCYNIRRAATRARNSEKYRLAMKKWRAENPEKIIEIRKRHAEKFPGLATIRARRRRHADPEKAARIQKKYYESHKKEFAIYAKKWAETNPEKKRAACQRSAKKCRKKMTDGYIKRAIARGSSLSSADIPDWMVDLKRQQLTLKRGIKNGNSTVEHQGTP